MVCRINASDGSVVEKFKSSSKAISALAVSPGMPMKLRRWFYVWFHPL
jgi:hypothetical protein